MNSGVLEGRQEGCSRAFVREGSIKDKDKTSTTRELVQPEPGACVCATQENQGFHALHTRCPSCDRHSISGQRRSGRYAKLIVLFCRSAYLGLGQMTTSCTCTVGLILNGKGKKSRGISVCLEIRGR
jgi:hypothetical protein